MLLETGLYRHSHIKNGLHQPAATTQILIEHKIHRHLLRRYELILTGSSLTTPQVTPLSQNTFNSLLFLHYTNNFSCSCMGYSMGYQFLGNNIITCLLLNAILNGLDLVLPHQTHSPLHIHDLSSWPEV